MRRFGDAEGTVPIPRRQRNGRLRPRDPRPRVVYLFEYLDFTRPHDDISAGVAQLAVAPGDGRHPDATG